MSYDILNNSNSGKNLEQENIALKKEISVLELSRKQLLIKAENYKVAYERYANNIVIRVIKKILRKQT